MIPQNRSILEQLLVSRIDFHEVKNAVFKPGYATESLIVPSCRLIFLRKGAIQYTVEKTVAQHAVRTCLFVPAWVWRGWQVVSADSAEMIWVNFTPNVGLVNLLEQKLCYQPEDFDLMLDRVLLLLELWQQKARNEMLMEGEFKALLARFLFHVPDDGSHDLESDHHPEVRRAIRFLQRHFREPGALSAMQAQLELNPDYFRALFHSQAHLSPHQYLNMLRMRAARHYLQDGRLTIKEVAVNTGFSDPLYFSRAYRKFWSRAPSEDRG